MIVEVKVISSDFETVCGWASFGIGSLSSAKALELLSEGTLFRVGVSALRVNGCEGVEVLGCVWRGEEGLGERERTLGRLLPDDLVLLFISTMCSSAKISISLSTFCNGKEKKDSKTKKKCVCMCVYACNLPCCL